MNYNDCKKDINIFNDKKPYYGPRMNSSNIVIPVEPDFKRTKNLISV